VCCMGIGRQEGAVLERKGTMDEWLRSRNRPQSCCVLTTLMMDEWLRSRNRPQSCCVLTTLTMDEWLRSRNRPQACCVLTTLTRHLFARVQCVKGPNNLINKKKLGQPEMFAGVLHRLVSGMRRR